MGAYIEDEAFYYWC